MALQRAKEIQVVCIYSGVILAQLLWHWFLSTQHAAAQTLLGIYLYRGHWNVEGYLDLIFPGAVAGIVIGRIGWQWSARKLFLFAFFAGIGLVAITPLYVLLLEGKAVWWWPRTHSEVVRAFVFQLFKAWTLVGFFAYFGHVFGLHAHSRDRPNATR